MRMKMNAGVGIIGGVQVFAVGPEIFRITHDMTEDLGRELGGLGVNAQQAVMLRESAGKLSAGHGGTPDGRSFRFSDDISRLDGVLEDIGRFTVIDDGTL